jgi:hypothetical protein
MIEDMTTDPNELIETACPVCSKLLDNCQCVECPNCSGLGVILHLQISCEKCYGYGILRPNEGAK